MLAAAAAAEALTCGEDFDSCSDIWMALAMSSSSCWLDTALGFELALGRWRWKGDVGEISIWSDGQELNYVLRSTG